MSPSSSPQNILPIRLMPFIGRKVELQALSNLLSEPSVRLVTILGPGGIGKTRLALEAAAWLTDRFPGGIFFVPLAQLNAADELLPALAERLGVRLSPGSDLLQVLCERLRDQQALLILDNFEHLLREAPLINDLLSAAPQVRILATSREKLDLAAESLFHLEGMELPAGEHIDASGTDALQLFIQKAHQVRPDFTLYEANLTGALRICKLVGGSPLGILLAAAWVEHFTPHEIFAEISHNLDFLTSKARDIDPRHHTLRAVFDSSYRQLDDQQQAALRKLGCFRGGFTLPAARAVAQADLQTLIALVDKSLLLRVAETGRYSLHDLLRQYANQELQASDEQESILAAHARYYMTFTGERAARLVSRQQNEALDEIQADFDNIRQALAETVAQRDYATARAVLPSLYAYCDIRSKIYEGESMFRLASEGLAPPGSAAPDAAWALALLSWYDLRTYIERFTSFEPIHAQAKRCLQQAELAQDPQGMAASLVLLGAILEGQGNFKAAIQYYKKGLRVYSPLDDAYWVNMRVGLAYQALGEYAKAIRAYQACYRRGQETGERARIGWSLLNIGWALLEQSKPREAEAYLARAREQFSQVGNPVGSVWANYYLGQAALELADTDRARGFALLAAETARQIHSSNWIRKTAELLGRIDLQAAPRTTEPLKLENEAFSSRELEVLRLLKSELSGPEIANRLFVSLNTVRFHTKNIYQKLGVNSRLEAIQRAKELGL
jgi:predicted ATPase/DNA-binding CsgD family transcriptional regulator